MAADQAKVSKLYKALLQVEHARARFCANCFTLPERSGYSLQAYADCLGSYYAIYSRQAVLVGDEVQQWAEFDAYCLA